jgi:hypothetical protein
MYTRTHSDTHTHTHKPTHTHTCTHTHSHTHTLTHSHTHTHSHAQTHGDTHSRTGLPFCACVRGRRRWTPLHWAADKGHAAVAAALLAHGVYVNAKYDSKFGRDRSLEG